jgi:hypothetical protein
MLGFAFALYKKVEARGVLMGSLGFLLSRLWLSSHALVFVCLMQSLNYMLWMKTCLVIFPLESENGFSIQ